MPSANISQRPSVSKPMTKVRCEQCTVAVDRSGRPRLPPAPRDTSEMSSRATSSNLSPPTTLAELLCDRQNMRDSALRGGACVWRSVLREAHVAGEALRLEALEKRTRACVRVEVVDAFGGLSVARVLGRREALVFHRSLKLQNEQVRRSPHARRLVHRIRTLCRRPANRLRLHRVAAAAEPADAEEARRVRRFVAF
ncbi:hypothetical protein M885DRAFT_510759 [Pelagophyceae sp. CCMP2097]|nr:hypothetical protein M885DRAFT_510759 [Pelagophyceae sp. CCMP2097]